MVLSQPPLKSNRSVGRSLTLSHGELRLLPDELGEVTLHLFFDHTIAEAFWQERVAMTLPLSEDCPGSDDDGGGGGAAAAACAYELEVSATSDDDAAAAAASGGSSEPAASLVRATVWSVGSTWVTPEQVIDQTFDDAV